MQPKVDQRQQAEWLNHAILIHDVFVKNERGKELLDKWVERLLYVEGHVHGKDAYDLGRVEGEKNFVRGIMQAIKQAEGKQ